MLESPLDCREFKPVRPKGNQSWVYIGRTDAETPLLWPPDANSWLIGKDPDAGKDWGHKKRATKDEVVGWHRWFSGDELGQSPGDSEGQGEWRAAVHGAAKTWRMNNSNNSFLSFWVKVLAQIRHLKREVTMRTTSSLLTNERTRVLQKLSVYKTLNLIPHWKPKGYFSGAECLLKEVRVLADLDFNILC